MKYFNATCVQRFFTYLIDFFIITTIASLIARVIPAYSQNVAIFQEDLEIIFNQVVADNVDLLLYEEMVKAGLIYMGILLSITLLVTFLYLVVLPYYWPTQTVGRLIMGVKVINLRGNERVSFGKLALRELVGSFLLYQVLGNTLILTLLNWYYCATRGRSFADMIGGTRLVYVRGGTIDESNDPNDKNSDYDYVDAEFHEVKSAASEEEPKDNSSDDEYKVF